jgi:ABC-type transporter Mla subunit MlaD
VRNARDLVEEIDDAIAHLNARITEIEHKIAAEQEKAKRAEAATELGRYADQLSAAIDAFAMTVAPLAKAIPDVVGHTPHANLDFGRGVEQLLGGVERELRNVVASARLKALPRVQCGFWFSFTSRSYSSASSR